MSLFCFCWNRPHVGDEATAPPAQVCASFFVRPHHAKSTHAEERALLGCVHLIFLSTCDRRLSTWWRTKFSKTYYAAMRVRGFASATCSRPLTQKSVLCSAAFIFFHATDDCQHVVVDEVQQQTSCGRQDIVASEPPSKRGGGMSCILIPNHTMTLSLRLSTNKLGRGVTAPRCHHHRFPVFRRLTRAKSEALNIGPPRPRPRPRPRPAEAAKPRSAAARRRCMVAAAVAAAAAAAGAPPPRPAPVPPAFPPRGERGLRLGRL